MSKNFIIQRGVCGQITIFACFCLLVLAWVEYRESPDSTVFMPPGNRTIAKTVLIGDWFSTKIAFHDFWIFKVPFFAWFIYCTQENFSLYFNHNQLA